MYIVVYVLLHETHFKLINHIINVHVVVGSLYYY